MTSELLTEQRIEVSQVEGGFALFSVSSGAIVITNAFGKALFDQLRSGVFAREASLLLAEEFDIPADDAVLIVQEIVQQWRDAGLYKCEYDPYLLPVDYRPAVDPHVRTYRHGQHSITLACEDVRVFEQLTSVLGPLEQDGQDDGAERLEVITVDEGYGPFLDGVALWGNCHIDEVRHLAIREVLECLCGRSDAGASLHASSVGRDGRALVFAGESGSGKTTLGLGLVGQGCTYVADDHVILNRDGVNAFATPLAASAKARSWALDEVAPFLDPADPDAPRAGVRYARPDNPAPFFSSHAVSAIVFPKYSADDGNRIARISASEGMLRLVKAGARTTRSVNSLRPLARVLNSVPCYELIFDNSGFSVSTCQNLLQGWSP